MSKTASIGLFNAVILNKNGKIPPLNEENEENFAEIYINLNFHLEKTHKKLYNIY